MKSKRMLIKIITSIIMLLMTLFISSNLNTVIAATAYDEVAAWGGERIIQKLDEIKQWLGEASTSIYSTKDQDSIFLYNNLLCADYPHYTKDKWMGLKYSGVIDIKPIFKPVDPVTQAYPIDQTYQINTELKTSNGTFTGLEKGNAAYLAYNAWATTSGVYRGGTKTWQNHWYEVYPEFYDFVGGKVTAWLEHWKTDSWNPAYIQNVNQDANNYSSFISQIGEDNKFLSNDQNKKVQTFNGNEAIIEFDKLVIDKNTYAGTGTDQYIGVYVMAANGNQAGFWVDVNGAHIENGFGLTINGKSMDEIKLADLASETNKWTIKWNDPAVNEKNPIQSIQVTSEFYSYRGAIIILTPDEENGTLQARVVVGGKQERVKAKIIFGVTNEQGLKITKLWSGYEGHTMKPDNLVIVKVIPEFDGLAHEEDCFCTVAIQPKQDSDNWDAEFTQKEIIDHMDETEKAKFEEWTNEKGFSVTGYTVKEVTIEGFDEDEAKCWSTGEAEPQNGNRYDWAIRNQYIPQDEPDEPDGDPVPLLELDKIGENGKQVVGAELTVNIDGYYSKNCTTTMNSPDITILYGDVLAVNKKMMNDLSKIDAVKLFDYEPNDGGWNGPVGDFGKTSAYGGIKGELKKKLNERLITTPGYEHDIAHLESFYTCTHRPGSEYEWSHEVCDLCTREDPMGAEITAGSCGARARINAAKRAIEDYVGGASLLIKIGDNQYTTVNDGLTYVGGDKHDEVHYVWYPTIYTGDEGIYGDEAFLAYKNMNGDTQTYHWVQQSPWDPQYKIYDWNHVYDNQGKNIVYFQGTICDLRQYEYNNGNARPIDETLYDRSTGEKVIIPIGTGAEDTIIQDNGIQKYSSESISLVAGGEPKTIGSRQVVEEDGNISYEQGFVEEINNGQKVSLCIGGEKVVERKIEKNTKNEWVYTTNLDSSKKYAMSEDSNETYRIAFSGTDQFFYRDENENGIYDEDETDIRSLDSVTELYELNEGERVQMKKDSITRYEYCENADGSHEVKKTEKMVFSTKVESGSTIKDSNDNIKRIDFDIGGNPIHYESPDNTNKIWSVDAEGEYVGGTAITDRREIQRISQRDDVDIKYTGKSPKDILDIMKDENGCDPVRM